MSASPSRALWYVKFFTFKFEVLSCGAGDKAPEAKKSPVAIPPNATWLMFNVSNMYPRSIDLRLILRMSS